jgi:hypothetical protein
VNPVELEAYPAVVKPILPVFAAVGTVAMTCLLETIVKLGASTPPNVTAVVCAGLDGDLQRDEIVGAELGPQDGPRLCGIALQLTIGVDVICMIPEQSTNAA